MFDFIKDSSTDFESEKIETCFISFCETKCKASNMARAFTEKIDKNFAALNNLEDESSIVVSAKPVNSNSGDL